ncbi:hypothetical protein MIR68_008628 [Amoeboaphelidium protococcarum]|nr:hypothetical protein MIR68_008628 [Amoeboaphelidium protococcarum]
MTKRKMKDSDDINLRKFYKNLDGDQGRSNEDDNIIASYSAMLTLKNQLVCSICTDFLCAPYTLQCGHSYCYACVKYWFQTQINNQEENNDAENEEVPVIINNEFTCAECRCVIEQPPVKSNALQMVMDQLIDTLLKPADVADYQRRLNEAKHMILEDERLNLLKTWFNRQRALRDEELNIRRCVVCLWELEGDYCENCDETYSHNSDYDNDEDDLEDEFDQDEPLFDEHGNDLNQYLDTDEDLTDIELRAAGSNARNVIVISDDDDDDDNDYESDSGHQQDVSDHSEISTDVDELDSEDQSDDGDLVDMEASEDDDTSDTEDSEDG